MNFGLDIRSGVLTAVILASLGTVIYLIAGIRSIRASRNIAFYRIRQEGMVRGWRLLFFGLLLAVLAVLVNSYAEPLAYSFFPPSATPTLTPTITITPTVTPTPSITLTPTITSTPSESNTPTPTSTPFVPDAIAALFEGSMTVPPSAVFSSLQFTQGIDENYVALSPGEVFDNPVGHLYGLFSYDQMVDGVQWTALWFREGTLVYYETEPWNGGTGGIGYTDWEPPAVEWLAGNYQVQMFLGLELKVVGGFLVQGEPPTPTPSTTPTITYTPTITPWPTQTRTVTPTPPNTPGPTATNTPRPTYPPTITPTPTITRWPTATAITPTATITKWPTPTPIPPTTNTPTGDILARVRTAQKGDLFLLAQN